MKNLLVATVATVATIASKQPLLHGYGSFV